MPPTCATFLSYFWFSNNVLHTVSTQQYINTVIQYIQLGHLRPHVSTVNGHLQANEEHY